VRPRFAGEGRIADPPRRVSRLRSSQPGLRGTISPWNLWWPNLAGAQPLYMVTWVLLDAQGRELDRQARRIGFKHVEWAPCAGAPEGADPWLCIVNGRPLFLQGVEFAPLCANYADLTRPDYERRLRQYREFGLNLFRINACQFLERQWFYDLCDELGLMVWQEFPLTSSGLENWPPEDERTIADMAAIATSFIERRRHHVSLLLWGGGNEQMGDLDGRKNRHGEALRHRPSHAQTSGRGGAGAGSRPPLPSHLALRTPRQRQSGGFRQGAALGRTRRRGQRNTGRAGRYWAADDALFRPEVYCSGASPVALIEKYAGDSRPSPPPRTIRTGPA